MQRQALWLEAIERRIAATNAMLNSMKGVKMCGLTDVLREDLQQLRVDELNISKKFRKLLIWTMGFCRYSALHLPSLLTSISIHFPDCFSHSCFRGVLCTIPEKRRDKYTGHCNRLHISVVIYLAD